MLLDLAPFVALLLCAAGVAAELREPWLALLAVPAVLWLPGLPWARALAARDEHDGDWVRVGIDAFWIGALLAIPTVALGRLTVAPVHSPWVSLGAAAGWTVAGTLIRRRAALSGDDSGPRRAYRTLSRGETVGVLSALLLVGLWFWQARVDIARPLDRYWWSEEADALPEEASPIEASGWASVAPIGDEGQGVRLVASASSADNQALSIRQAASQPLLVAVRGPVWSVASVGVDGIVIEASPTVEVEEGPVRRYLASKGGVASIFIPAVEDARELSVRLVNPTDATDADLTVYALASQAALWDLDGSGELRFVHYYQLLNMVEQFDWAESRWLTDVQPPMWTWVLAAPLAVTRGDMPTANVLLASILLLSALSGIRFIYTHAPDAPLTAWILPGAAAMVTGKLISVPGSASMPDALYAAAIVGALASLGDTGKRSEILGLFSQLLRYPGYAVVVVGTILAGRRREAIRLTGVVVLAAVAFGLGGLATGALDGWLATVAWESGPEHWHGNTDPSALLERVLPFYQTWFAYSGGAVLLAAVAWPMGTRIALGTALVYSLLLCTIDHSPTHYFLPLVQLSVVATATTASAIRSRSASTLLPIGVLAGLLIFQIRGEIRG